MQIRTTAILAVALFGCRNNDGTTHTDSVSTRLPDSTALTAYEDSILGNPSTDVVVLPNGDTLRIIGGTMMDQNEARDYGIDLYTKNAVPYIRIAKIVARTPNRQPIKSSIARMRLVPIDSTEEVITEGLCSVNETNDPFVIGIVRPVGDSVQWHASHAWRFDIKSGTIREISVSGVKCAHIVGED